MAAATVALADALKLQRPDVLGFSLGGMVALQLAADYPGRFGAIVASSGSFGGDAAPRPPEGLALFSQ